MLQHSMADFRVPESLGGQNKLVVGALAGTLAAVTVAKMVARKRRRRQGPLVVATWRFGQRACEHVAQVLAKSPGTLTALDLVEEAVNVVELDESVRSFVGLGGLPNEEGEMEHDAAMMDGRSLGVGCVMALKHIASPIRVARRVLAQENLNVVAGEGALKFALREGFREETTLSMAAAREWEVWHAGHSASNSQEELNVFAFLSGAMSSSVGAPQAEGPRPDLASGFPHDLHAHDTIGVIALDKDGNLAVGTSTSGAMFSPAGRVGDAPLIGSGFYADNSAGAAVATGVGEEIMKTCLCFSVVEGMRQGYSPAAACQRAIDRLKANNSSSNRGRALPSVSVVAMDVRGEVGAATTICQACPIGHPDASSNPNAFQYAMLHEGQCEVLEVSDA